MISIKKFIFDNGCGEFKLEMRANTVPLSVGQGYFTALENTETLDSEFIIERTFYSVTTGEDLDIMRKLGDNWAINYIGSCEDYHLFELMPAPVLDEIAEIE